DVGNVVHLAKVILLAHQYSGIRFIYDTFMDVDRGYFPRHAFIDRQFNPRPMARAFAMLMSILSGVGSLRCTEGAAQDEGVLECSTPHNRYQLLSLPTRQAWERLSRIPPDALIIDLLSGCQRRCDEQVDMWRSAPDTDTHPLQVILATAQQSSSH